MAIPSAPADSVGRSLRTLAIGVGLGGLMVCSGVGVVWGSSPWWGVFDTRGLAAWAISSAQATWWGGFLLALVALPILMWVWPRQSQNTGRKLRRSAVIATVLSAVLVLGFVLISVVLVRQAAASPGPKSEGHLRVFAANTLYYRENSVTIAATARDIGADIVVLSETSEDEVAAVEAATGLHSVMSVSGQTGANATALLVPAALLVSGSAADLTITRHQNPMAVLGTSPTVTIVGVHTYAPVNAELTDGRNQEIDDLKRWAENVEGPLIVAGDFNATAAHPEFRRLISDAKSAPGLVECTGSTRFFGGAMDAPTWPRSGKAPFPLLRLDHALVRGATCVAGGVMDTPGSDHRAVWADLQLTQ